MSDEPKSGFTRRDLVRGAIVGAVVAGVAPRSAPAEPSAVGPGAVPLELNINGQVHHLTVEPRVVLADALRDRLGLTGTKVVCGRGACGACTVLVDGQASCSCLMLAHEVRGKRITTIEGLTRDGAPAAIQAAFVASDAMQCGFCTPGMVMSCEALLARNPRPSREEIRDAVAGNLCRCGTYPHVFEAVEQAAGLRPAHAAGEPPERIATSLPGGALRLTSDDRVDDALAALPGAEEGLA
ncbi:MAG TPA: 2Fe-2S iron-sulfur cluster-binding protein [Thermoanaerobaculia bacterium]|nr:2Fe-2S iron-sulfur cluster-binding protein [Thermoanaerobaculia bacterium]